MSHYCGIDLHSNNHVVVVIDEEDKRVFDKRLNNDLSATLSALAPYRETLQGIAVESTFNWYWLVDGLTRCLVSMCGWSTRLRSNNTMV